MRWNGINIAAAGRCLPDPVLVKDAVSSGHYDAATAKRADLVSITVAKEDTAPADLAVTAGRTALTRSGHRTSDVAVLLHATTSYQGMEAWNPAAYIQGMIGCVQALATEVRSGCNAGMASLELAASFLTADPSRTCALVTAADTFTGDNPSRWRVFSGTVFADGASAIVLSKTHGFARLCVSATVNDPELEGLHRGTIAFHSTQDERRLHVNLDERMIEFSRKGMAPTEISKRMRAGMAEVAERVLDEAGLERDDISYWLTPNLGRHLMTETLEALEIDMSRTMWDWGRTIGHVGGADQFASLDRLLEIEALHSGDRVALVGSGAGWSWTCAVIEMV